LQLLVRRLRALQREDLELRFRSELSSFLGRRQLIARILTVQGRSGNNSIVAWTPGKGKDKDPKLKVKRTNF
jgi:hypothetical protein